MNLEQPKKETSIVSHFENIAGQNEVPAPKIISSLSVDAVTRMVESRANSYEQQ